MRGDFHSHGPLSHLILPVLSQWSHIVARPLPACLPALLYYSLIGSDFWFPLTTKRVSDDTSGWFVERRNELWETQWHFAASSNGDEFRTIECKEISSEALCISFVGVALNRGQLFQEFDISFEWNLQSVNSLDSDSTDENYSCRRLMRNFPRAIVLSSVSHERTLPRLSTVRNVFL